MSLKSKIRKDKEYEIFVALRKPLNRKKQDELQDDLRKYDVRETYYLSEDKPKHRREWFFKKSKER